MSHWPRRPGRHHRPHPPTTTTTGTPAGQPWHDPRYRHGIVVGYSGSPASRRALAYAEGVAGRIGAGLVIVHVARRLHGTGRHPGNQPPPVPSMPRPGTGAPTLWVTVHTGSRICREIDTIAGQYAADAIIVGAGHRTPTRILGHVGSTLARHPRCPVIVIP